MSADADTLRDAMRDVLDICAGWTQYLTDAERLAAIRGIAERALPAPDPSPAEREQGHR